MSCIVSSYIVSLDKLGNARVLVLWRPMDTLNEGPDLQNAVANVDLLDGVTRRLLDPEISRT